MGVVGKMEKLTSMDCLEFFRRFLDGNKPCLLDEGLTSSWKARKLWQSEGKPNFDYLVKEFGQYPNCLQTTLINANDTIAYIACRKYIYSARHSL